MLLVKNKKAFHNNEVLERYVAGIVLSGSEVKAIKEGSANFEGSYVTLVSGLPYIVNLTIGCYSKDGSSKEKPRQPSQRNLLLTKKEINSLQRDLSQKGKTAIPLAFLLEHGLVKLEFAVVRGLKKFEKKEKEKQRQIDRDLLAHQRIKIS